MPKAQKNGRGVKSKVYAMPSAQRKKDLGVPKLNVSKLVGRQAMPYGKSRPVAGPSTAIPSMSELASSSSMNIDDPIAGPSSETYAPVDASLTIRDSSAKAFMRELRKVIERSDVIIQVLDARDPDGTRSRWVEEEVRKRENDGKKLLAVMNKIDLVPRSNLEAWLRHLRHSFPTMPFKSSTQAQRANLSQNAVPLSQPSTVPGQSAAFQPLPSTSSSLGAPALIHLLKQYALSTPHSALTVGVVGYPNVGKSSLINSLKRSRACAVAAMPGKTRVVQEVVLDKGVKILDCPGVVLEDVGRELDGEEGRRKQAEIMLRNCIKAELVEDPISPVEVILAKTDPTLLQKLYNIPPFDDVRDFLIKIALTRGRLGKGGIPDLEGSAVSVLRDWNSGKIAYFTVPPAFHPSSAPAAASAGDVEMTSGGEKVGDARILTSLSEAFTLEGLFDQVGDDATWDEGGEDGFVQDEMEEDPTVVSEPQPPVPTLPLASLDNRQAVSAGPLFPSHTAVPNTIIASKAPAVTASKLFTSDELAVLPSNLLDRQKAKSAAKKAKKRKAESEQTEGELMFGFLGMGVTEPEPDVPDAPVPLSRKEKKRGKWLERKAAQAAMQAGTPEILPEEGAEEGRKEKEFASFLAKMGADSDEEL